MNDATEKLYAEDMLKLTMLTLAGAFAVSAVAFAADGDATKGKEVFEQCTVCHNSDSAERKMGPGLKGEFKKDKMANGKAPTEANVRALINNGGGGMPAYNDMLTDAEKNDLIAFLKTL